MRIDHYAYQRATHVAGFGLILQGVMWLTLLLFGRIANDDSLALASVYVMYGMLVWIALILIFYQHKQERLEALEFDELAASRESVESVFEEEREQRIAARRLDFMHKWVMPGFSLLLAVLLILSAWRIFSGLEGLQADSFAEGSEIEFNSAPGWAVAVCLAFAAISFVFSRFVAGMARQEAWQNLRGGAAYMVGNALIMLALAGGIIGRFFETEQIIRIVVFAIPVFMLIVAVEILLNFVLNLYRPRIPGDVPRPAFDSKLLSLFAAPDNLVRSINEAINYQFGFDITSSWGYQLILRSFVSLIVFGLVVLVLLSTMVVVEPHQQAIRLRQGAIVDASGPGIMWKWPWPFETSAVYNTSRLRDMPLTAVRVPPDDAAPGMVQVNLWSEELDTDRELEPFVVRGTRLGLTAQERQDIETADETELRTDIALVDAEIYLQYRIKGDAADTEQSNLIKYLNFADDTVIQRDGSTMREVALKDLALDVVRQRFTALSIDEALARQVTRTNPQTGEPEQQPLGELFAELIQGEFDRRETGVEVVAVKIPTMRPTGRAAGSFESLAVASQEAAQSLAQASEAAITTMTSQIGNPRNLEAVTTAIDAFNDARAELPPDDPRLVELRLEAQAALEAAGGSAAQGIAAAEAERWITRISEQTRTLDYAAQLELYRTAPRLYRQIALMDVLRAALAGQRKFVIDDDLTFEPTIDNQAPLSMFDLATPSNATGDE